MAYEGQSYSLQTLKLSSIYSAVEGNPGFWLLQLRIFLEMRLNIKKQITRFMNIPDFRDTEFYDSLHVSIFMLKAGVKEHEHERFEHACSCFVREHEQNTNMENF